MKPATKQAINIAEEEQVTDQDLDESYTLQEGVWVPIFSATATRSTAYQPGLGVQNRNLATGFSDLDLVDDGSNDVQGKLRWAIYESEDLDNLVAKQKVGSVRQYRDAVDSNRTEKPIVFQRQPGASQDRVLVLECKATASANDGNSVSQANSNANQGMKYASL